MASGLKRRVEMENHVCAVQNRIEEQLAFIETLAESGRPTFGAENLLASYLSLLDHLTVLREHLSPQPVSASQASRPAAATMMLQVGA